MHVLSVCPIFKIMPIRLALKNTSPKLTSANVLPMM